MSRRHKGGTADGMKSSKRIFVYMEDTPVHRDVVAHGLCRAAPPILRSISQYIDGIAIYPTGQRFTESDLDRELAPLCYTVPGFATLISKGFRRFPALDFGISDWLPTQVLASVVKRSDADILFSFVGADYSALIRAGRLAGLTGKSCVFYLVDDFLAAMRISGAQPADMTKAAAMSQDILRRAKHVFTITDGLGEHFRESFGIAPTTLRIAFEPEPVPAPPRKKQIIYVGSVNFLYASGLRDLFKLVDQIRRNSGEDLTVRLTADMAVASEQLGNLPSFVTSAPLESSDALAKEIASSLFAFLPYSFDLREKAMVSTSFPSKSLEYLASARSIVVYGPEYGVATKLFREEGMPSVTSSSKELLAVILEHLAASPDHSTVYRNYLATEHGLAVIRKTFCQDLDLGS
jgi:hypothetical protein